MDWKKGSRIQWKKGEKRREKEASGVRRKKERERESTSNIDAAASFLRCIDRPLCLKSFKEEEKEKKNKEKKERRKGVQKKEKVEGDVVVVWRLPHPPRRDRHRSYLVKTTERKKKRKSYLFLF